MTVGKFAFVFLFLLSGVFGQAEEQFKPLTAKASVRPDRIPIGANAELNVELDLDSEYHAYLDQFRLEVLKPDGLQLSHFTITPTVSFFDKYSKKNKEGVKGKAVMKAVLAITESLAPGDVRAQLALTYQACSKKHCLLPKEILLDLDFTVTPASAEFGKAATKEPLSLNQKFQNALESNLYLAFLLVFIAGILTSLTPCIFPMLPITLAILGTRQGHTRAQNFFTSITYVLGIALTYSTLGLVAAATGTIFGSLLANPFVVTVIALIFGAMGLSMMGFYEITTPHGLTQFFSKFKAQQNYLGALTSGLIAGVVASPCVGPVLVSILTYVAQTQDLILGFSLLFVFALGLGQIFIIMGTFSHLFNKLPRSGPWMELIKLLFGSVMIAMALFYIYPLVTLSYFNIIVGAVFIALTFMYSIDKKRKGETLHHFQIGLLVAVSLVGLTALVEGIFPNTLIKKEVVALDAKYIKKTGAMNWLAYSEEVLAQAKAEGRPVMIDFFAEWCEACHELEQKTFPQKEIQELASQVTWIMFDATKMTDEFKALTKKYKIPGLPYLVFIDANGLWREDLTLAGFEEAPALRKRLDQIVKK